MSGRAGELEAGRSHISVSLCVRANTNRDLFQSDLQEAESGVLGNESMEGLRVEPDGKCIVAVASLLLCSCSRSSIGESVFSSLPFGSALSLSE